MILCETIKNAEWLFPQDWQLKINELIQSSSTNVVMDGSHMTSREEENSEPITISVVTGQHIHERIRWLYDAYTGPFLEIAKKCSRYNLKTSPDIASAININSIKGIGNRYEWHVDSNPLTGLLFVNTLNSNDGGKLLFKEEGEIVKIKPEAGTLLFFDAREIPHSVSSLKTEIERISIPMNYYFEDTSRREIMNKVPKEYAMGEKNE